MEHLDNFEAMKKQAFTFLLILISAITAAQDVDSAAIRKIFSYVLEEGAAYQRLDHLSNKIGGRVSGSPEAEKAVEWAKQTMQSDGIGKVYLQEVMVPHWVRNDKEIFTVYSKGKVYPISMCSLGNSIGTPQGGIRAGIINAGSFEELEQMDREKVKGKIIYFSKPMDQKHVMTFHAYGECGKFRYEGAIRAAKMGGIASVNRSLTLSFDDEPHTGAMGYQDSVTKVPGCAISVAGALKLNEILNDDPDAEAVIEMNCEMLPDKLSHNVIGEIKGTEHPEEIIVIGGHLDAWDKGDGAHDDGAGCVQAMELLHAFRNLGIQPKRTIRVVLFMNEENGLKGAAKYAEEAKAKNEKHIAAIESDAGGFTPDGFTYTCADSTKSEVLLKWRKLFEPYNIFIWNNSYGGADINKLKDQGTLCIGLLPDTQRYFDYHHSENDTFDKVNRRELHLGAASIISLAYLLSEYGVN